MSLVVAEGLHKQFGALEVLAGVELVIEPGEKLGLVGRNGGGKTTLLKVLAGEEAHERGRVRLRRGASLERVEQRPRFAPGESVRAFVESGLEHLREEARALEALAEQAAHASGDEQVRLLHEHDQRGEALRLAGGWQTERRVETVLGGLGVPESLWEREARTLSGGEQGRVSLARALVGGHDLVLLDEPTNHLDLAGIEWLEDWLRQSPSAALVVSHDRRLLTRAVSAILELERGLLARYPGSFPRYLELKAERHRAALREWEQQQEEIRREEAFIRQHLAGTRTAEAKGRQRRLERVVRLEKPRLEVRKPVIRAPAVEAGGELVLEARGLAGGRGERTLFAGLELRLSRGERLGIVGPNGAGKSTLLAVLGGRLAPARGELRHGQHARCGFFDQDTSGLVDERTPYEEVRRRHPLLSDQEVRDLLARFLFRRDEVERPVAALSGGERARLALALLLSEQPTWLALDEPTNHLDLAARAALEEMLSEFDGALVFVSHDRELLDGLATRLLVVREGTVELVEGNYATWRELERARELERREASAPRAKERSAEKAAQKAGAKAEERAGEGAARAGPERVRNPWAFARLEERILALESEQKQLEGALASEEVFRDPARLREVRERLAALAPELAAANAEWEAWEIG